MKLIKSKNLCKWENNDDRFEIEKENNGDITIWQYMPTISKGYMITLPKEDIKMLIKSLKILGE